MLPKVPLVELPGMTAIVQSAFNDALPLMRSRQRLWLIFAIIAAVAGLILPFMPSQTLTTATGETQVFPLARMETALQWPNLLGAISLLFVIGSVMRTVRPDWRWTVGLFFGGIGIVIVYALSFEIGLFLLLVPGVWIFVKWSQALYCWLLSEGKNPFGESWDITTGQFWETLLFIIFVVIVTEIPLAIVFGGAGALAGAVPLLGVILLPIAYLAYVFAMHIMSLAAVRWLLRLRARALALGLPRDPLAAPAI